ncbi:hypothetical protein SLEP1_g16980 [Rubroshorea leprosula]|uniref:Protein kinase domain-containing protein n=1 Tax=Rubroshorea leprosula TaxID=152421 RepID=A0AAV5IWF2_9ROSI|nr:hypothetical protein SLEP1_g16980 [Rubroshorea leprosula]
MFSTEGNVEKTKIFNIKELERAANNFNNNRILGQGSQGTIYKGMLVDGSIVAVKKSKVLDKEKVKEFINEVVILTWINHRNIVKDSFAHEGMKRVANLAYRCLSLSGKKWPRMIEVAMELEQIRLLQNNSNGQKNHEELRYAKSKVTNHCGIASGASLSLHIEPPLSSESWELLGKQVSSITI